MYFVFFSDRIPETFSFLPNIGIIALYTTFVLALGRVFRGMFTNTTIGVVQTDMADPFPVAELIRYISTARECGDLMLEQSVYYELIDLLRSPDRLLRVTGWHAKNGTVRETGGAGGGGAGGGAAAAEGRHSNRTAATEDAAGEGADAKGKSVIGEAPVDAAVALAVAKRKKQRLE